MTKRPGPLTERDIEHERRGGRLKSSQQTAKRRGLYSVARTIEDCKDSMFASVGLTRYALRKLGEFPSELRRIT